MTLQVIPRWVEWLPVEVTAGPASEPLSLADATNYLRADPTDVADQSEISTLITAARGLVEARTGLKLVTQTVRLRRGDFPTQIQLPVAPIQSITSVQYLDTNGALQTLDPTIWAGSLFGLYPLLRVVSGQSLPTLFTSPEAILVTATAGFTSVPTDIVQAMKLLCSQWYDSRDTFTDTRMTELPNTVEALLANWQIF